MLHLLKAPTIRDQGERVLRHCQFGWQYVLGAVFLRLLRRQVHIPRHLEA